MDRKVLVVLAGILILAAAGVAVFSFGGEEDGGLTVVYDGNGGECAIPDEKGLEAGDTVDLKFSPAPVKPGCSFLGWSLDGSGGVLDFSQLTGSTSVTVNDDIRLYAVYRSDKSYLEADSAVHMDLKEASQDGVKDPTATGSFDLAIDSVGEGCTDYSYNGDYSFNGDSFMGGSFGFSVSSYSKGIFGGITHMMETVDYTFDGKSVIALHVGCTDDDGVSYNVILDPIELVPYVLEVFKPGDLLPKVELRYELVSYELKYDLPEKVDGYHVYYDANGGVSTVTDGRSYAEGDSICLRADSLVHKEGMKFVGWSLEKDSGYPEYYSRYDLDMDMPGHDVTLYAVYVKDLRYAQAGTWLESVTETVYPDSPGLKVTETVRDTLSSRTESSMVFDRVGTRVTDDSGKVSQEDVRSSYDMLELREDYGSWGTQDVYEYKGELITVDVDNIEYGDGTKVTEYRDPFTWVLYKSVTEGVDDDGDRYTSTYILTDYSIAGN